MGGTLIINSAKYFNSTKYSMREAGIRARGQAALWQNWLEEPVSACCVYSVFQIRLLQCILLSTIHSWITRVVGVHQGPWATTSCFVSIWKTQGSNFLLMSKRVMGSKPRWALGQEKESDSLWQKKAQPEWRRSKNPYASGETVATEVLSRRKNKVLISGSTQNTHNT